MKKYLKYLLLCIILVGVVIFKVTHRGYIYTKLSDAQGIPEKVSAVLAELEIERGIYYFAETFTGESAYVVVCGGEQYKEGYDVNITDLNYNMFIEQAVAPPIEPMYGFYSLKLKEDRASDNYDYGIKTKSPIVVFEISGKVGLQAWPVISLESDLSIIKWWGLNAKSLEKEDVIIEIIEHEEQAPEYFADLNLHFTGYFLRDSKKQLNGSIYEVYLADDKEPFTLSLESIGINRTYCRGYPYDIVVKKHLVDTPLFEVEGVPYVVVKTTVKSEKYYPRKMLCFNENLTWELKK